MKRSIRVDFSDFWPGFDKADNWWTRTLSQRFDLQISSHPDVLIYSCYGTDWKNFDCVRVFTSWENRGWGFSQCDWAFTSDLVDHPRHYRLPLWVAWLDLPFEQPSVDVAAALERQRGFASIVVSNAGSSARNRLHERLDHYRPVASGGRFRNNVGGPVADKLAFIGRYKFNLAFENSSHPGYVTEKLLHALQADTVPIYWGDPGAERDFNPHRFVNVHDFSSDDALLEHVTALDRDDSAYSAMLSEPWFSENVTPPCAGVDALLDRFEQIAEWSGTPIAQRRDPGTWPLSIRDRFAIRHRYRHRSH